MGTIKSEVGRIFGTDLKMDLRRQNNCILGLKRLSYISKSKGLNANPNEICFLDLTDPKHNRK